MDKIVVNVEESGYCLLECVDFCSVEYCVGGVKGICEVLKWIFVVKEGEVFLLYECGENDYLMVVVFEKINFVGYCNINLVVDMLKVEIIKDKKVEKLIVEMKGVNSID